jgi:uncharacterized protein (TIGR03435 family)
MRKLIFAGFTMMAVAGWVSAQAPKKPAFEVASIRPDVFGSHPRSIQYSAGGRFTASNVPLRALIEEAYAIRDFQVSGGPDWVNRDQFNIAAKAEGDASKGQVRVMLQTLLAERFQLVLRRESKEVSVYTLTVGKTGPKLKEVKLDEDNATRGMRFGGIGRIAGAMATMPQLVVMLSDIKLNGSAILDRPVLDRTGLTGVYDFKLEWSAEEQSADRTTSTNPAGPSIFTAVQEQLGLKLESTKAPVEFFVIEQAGKPTEN